MPELLKICGPRPIFRGIRRVRYALHSLICERDFMDTNPLLAHLGAYRPTRLILAGLGTIVVYVLMILVPGIHR